MRETLYEILGVEKAATGEELAAAFQRRKVQLEAAGDPDSRNELKRVLHSHQTLSNPVRRAQYDQRLAAESQNEAVMLTMEPHTGGSSGLLKFLLLLALAGGAYLAYQKMATRAKGAEAAPVAVQPQASPATQSPSSGDSAVVPAQDAPQSAAAEVPAKPADIYDVNAVPLPNPATQRNAYVAFLALKGSRAFAICNDGRVISYGGSAQSVSQRLASMPYGCSAYAVDDHVVWVGNK